ncbi:hypothetical protein EVAR_21237_1 [Eumeta japonica]|uniref:General transcription factor II-I repeat domain-containing protein 2A n=1 Tax=Eumeta variegata TaxID=151549 RepID=A0A4C1Z4N4_EUMVA|nr:hypothetical protein EVAR_21237_1 [Eumeta japonica]
MMANDIKTTLTERMAGFESFSIALDESTDLSDTAQLAIFIRALNVARELICTLKFGPQHVKGCPIMLEANTKRVDAAAGRATVSINRRTIKQKQGSRGRIEVAAALARAPNAARPDRGRRIKLK